MTASPNIMPVRKDPIRKDRRTGKIARLPKENRDAINRMIQDGVPHQQIIDSLGQLGRELGINRHHLIRWKQDAYQDWLKEQEQQHLDAVPTEKESPLDAVKQNGGTDIQETALRLPASQTHQILKRFRKQTLKDLLREDPKNYAAMVNSMAKLNKAALDIEKFKQAVSEQRKQREAELDQDKPRTLSPETIAKCQEMLKRM